MNTALAATLATLPVALAAGPTVSGPTLGALIVALIWGLLLLGFGATLLRPMVVLAALITGVLVGVVVARTWVPTVPLWVAASAGGLLGVIAGALLYRPVVATMSACVGATLGAVIAWAVIATGALDTRPRESGHALVASLRETPVFGEGERTSQEIIAIVTAGTDASARAAGTEPAPAAPATAGDRALRDISGLATRTADRMHAALTATPPAYRTLLYGSILTGAVAGFLAGLVATTLVARTLTSTAGATLLTAAAVPLMAVAGYAIHMRDARAWLLAIASFTMLGILAQTLLATRVAGTKPPARAKKPAPRPAGAAVAA